MKQNLYPKQFSIKHKASSRGFTLLEVILSLAIMSMLIGSVFTITSSSVLLSQTIVESQTEHRQHKNLEHYLESIFLNLPSDVQITLAEDTSGQQILTIDNPGTFFPNNQQDHYANHLQAYTTKNRDGLLNFNTAWKNVSDQDLTGGIESEFQHSLVLLNDLSSLKWEIYSSRDQLWVTTWETAQGRPSHIRLSYSSPSRQEQGARTFWIPPTVTIL